MRSRRFFLQSARADTHVTRATAAPRAFFSASIPASHLKIKREKRDTCPIRSFLYQPPTKIRETRSRTNVHHSPATQMSPSRSQVKACGSRPRATVATFANSLPASPAFLAFPFARAPLLWRCTAMGGGGQVQIYQTELYEI